MFEDFQSATDAALSDKLENFNLGEEEGDENGASNGA
jgi:hypothetical protein